MSTQDLVQRDTQGDTSRDSRQDKPESSLPALVPQVDVIEDETGITVTADLPGASRDTLSLDVNGDTLTIEAPVTLGESKDLQAVYAEVRSGRYRRSFTLSRELDSNAIEATLKDGVLTLRVPKIEQARPRRIEVRAA
jgi:HSP20 family protein